MFIAFGGKNINVYHICSIENRFNDENSYTIIVEMLNNQKLTEHFNADGQYPAKVYADQREIQLMRLIHALKEGSSTVTQ